MWTRLTLLEDGCSSYQGAHGGGHRSSSGGRCPGTNALDEPLQGQRHQASIVWRLHHIPAQKDIVT